MRREKEGRRRRRIGYWRLSRYFSSRVDPFILTLDITVFRGANRGQNRLTWNRVAVHRNPFSTRFNKYWRSRIEICMDGEIGKIFLLVKERSPTNNVAPLPCIAGEMETQLWRGATTSTMFASGEYHSLPRRKTELLNLILSVRSTWTRSPHPFFSTIELPGKTEIKLGSFVTQRRHRNAFVPRSLIFVFFIFRNNFVGIDN